ncbi:MAG: pitrilysin family protein [Gemmatimonadetes bacterium]|nr:pitrilysin family protein [Gemmatimonadota bacterium]
MSLRLEQIRNPRIRESVFVGAGNRPVPVYVHPKPEAHHAHALLAVEYGAIDGLSTGFTPGVAHFLEHRLFEKREGDISARFSALGADVDAQTGLTQTSFSVTCADGLAACVELLIRLALELHLSDEGVERERRIILREIELFADNVESVCFANALRALYPDHPISTDIAGTPASLGEIDRPLLRASHEHYYSAGRISLFASGKVAPEELCEVVDAHTSSLCRCPAGNLPRRRAPVPAPHRISSRLAVVRPRVSMAFHDSESGLEGIELLKKEICLDMAADILFGPSSEFFAEQYEAGEIDGDGFGWEIYAEPAFLFAVMGGDVSNSGRFEESVLKRLSRGVREGIASADFERAARKAYGTLLFRYEDIESCAAMAHGEVSRGARPFDSAAALEQVRRQDVEHCLRTCFTSENCAVSVVEPLPRSSTGPGVPVT